MKKRLLCGLLALIFVLSLAACGKEAAPSTGDEVLDAQIDEVFKELGIKDASSDAQTAAFLWVTENIRYRASGDGMPDPFDRAATLQLAAETMAKRKADCTGEAAIMCALLWRMGLEAEVVTGEFLRAGSDEWVSHAWVTATADGETRCFDPLYAVHFASDRMTDYCAASPEVLTDTHRSK